MFVTNIGVLALAIYLVSSSSHPWQWPSIDVLFVNPYNMSGAPVKAVRMTNNCYVSIGQHWSAYSSTSRKGSQD